MFIHLIADGWVWPCGDFFLLVLEDNIDRIWQWVSKKWTLINFLFFFLRRKNRTVIDLWKRFSTETVFKTQNKSHSRFQSRLKSLSPERCVWEVTKIPCHSWTALCHRTVYYYNYLVFTPGKVLRAALCRVHLHPHPYLHLPAWPSISTRIRLPRRSQGTGTVPTYRKISV